MIAEVCVLLLQSALCKLLEEDGGDLGQVVESSISEYDEQIKGAVMHYLAQQQKSHFMSQLHSEKYVENTVSPGMKKILSYLKDVCHPVMEDLEVDDILMKYERLNEDSTFATRFGLRRWIGQPHPRDPDQSGVQARFLASHS